MNEIKLGLRGSVNEFADTPTWQLLGLLEANHKIAFEDNPDKARQAMVVVEEINSEIVRRVEG